LWGRYKFKDLFNCYILVVIQVSETIFLYLKGIFSGHDCWLAKGLLSLSANWIDRNDMSYRWFSLYKLRAATFYKFPFELHFFRLNWFFFPFFMILYIRVEWFYMGKFQTMNFEKPVVLTVAHDYKKIVPQLFKILRSSTRASALKIKNLK
jgi:hypothetical protein